MTCNRWHRLGERCECGHITVPARFYADGANQKQAEVRYMEFLEANPEAAARMRQIEDVRATREYPAVLQGCVTGKCVTCGRDYSGRGKECGACRVKRSRAKR